MQRTYVCEQCGSEQTQTLFSGGHRRFCELCSQARKRALNLTDRARQNRRESYYRHREKILTKQRSLKRKQNSEGYSRARRHSLDAADVRLLYAMQGGRCAICHTPQPIRALHLDHDHACCADKNRSCGACFRGLICPVDNRMIGMAKDNPGRLVAAAEYLRNGVA